MSPQSHVFESSAAPSNRYAAALGGLRERTPRLFVIVVSGTLAIPGTSSAEPMRLWEGSYVREPESTASGSSWLLLEATVNTDEASGEATGRAISELRRISSLTWEQLGQLFNVSRRSVHFWASGKPLNAANEARLMRVLDIVREADRGDARSTRAALLEATDGVAPFDLLVSERFDEARTLLGTGTGRRDVPRTQLSAAAKAARRPLPPEERVDAMHDRIHRDVGRGRAARTVRNKRRERG